MRLGFGFSIKEPPVKSKPGGYNIKSLAKLDTVSEGLELSCQSQARRVTFAMEVYKSRSTPLLCKVAMYWKKTLITRSKLLTPLPAKLNWTLSELKALVM
eukprot:CAMPEP_0115351284 /NCGR_PEP_ID=MMETSP0270-20121206/96914_2 /TAXON_ID=71861 /ORGANISM="Scrippsiella trochoidea, Strain CCMP3099" /LENGTH=99 /DNA_ID=CAMNT_0002773427 /DNA_START=182 /DNA_END=481 /DNA_ORIENTATION=-